MEGQIKCVINGVLHHIYILFFSMDRFNADTIKCARENYLAPHQSSRSNRDGRSHTEGPTAPSAPATRRPSRSTTSSMTRERSPSIMIIDPPPNKSLHSEQRAQSLSVTTEVVRTALPPILSRRIQQRDQSPSVTTEVVRTALKQRRRLRHLLPSPANVELTGLHQPTSSLPRQGPSTRLELAVMPGGTRLARAPALPARSLLDHHPHQPPGPPAVLHRPGLAGAGALGRERTQLRPPPLHHPPLHQLQRHHRLKPSKKGGSPDRSQRNVRSPVRRHRHRKRRCPPSPPRRLHYPPPVRNQRPTTVTVLP